MFVGDNTNKGNNPKTGAITYGTGRGELINKKELESNSNKDTPQ